MSYIKMKIQDVIDNLEETGYDFNEVAKRMAMSLTEVKELAKEFSDMPIEDEEYDTMD